MTLAHQTLYFKD